MVSAKDFEKLLTEVLHKAAQKLNLNNYSLNLNLNAIKGDGFLGEFYKVSITDNETDKTYHLAVKKAPTEQLQREQNNIEWVYKNEIFVYSEIFPAFKRFEQQHQVEQPFDSMPEFITSNNEIGSEIIVFKDITKKGYILREKDLLLDDEHAKLVFETYGHFHAISFCMKKQNPEEFEKLAKPLRNLWREIGAKDAFMNILRKLQNKVYESLDPSEDALVIEKFKKYIDNTKEIFEKSGDYQGQYYGILHGDCWSNNMMFKYQDHQKLSNLEGMNLLDFQLSMSGTPVHDLSYFFYTGGSKELFDKLEEYLDIYHESFSAAARHLGEDPNKLLPRDVLTQDWKKYARHGMMLATMLTKIKLISKEDSIEIIDNIGKQTEPNNDDGEAFMAIKYNEELFKKRVRDIVVHMHEIDAL